MKIKFWRIEGRHWARVANVMLNNRNPGQHSEANVKFYIEHLQEFIEGRKEFKYGERK